MSPIGDPVDRVEGKSKVTGAARYAADFPLAGLAYGVPVVSTIGRGRLLSIDSSAAGRAPGVLAVITRENCPKLNQTSNDFGSWTKLGEARLPFEDDEIHYAGQYIALVVAETLEQAVAAARLVKVRYEERTPALGLEDPLQAGYTPKGMGFAPIDYQRGDVSRAIEGTPYRVDESYSTPVEHHNPMEPSATTAVWIDGDLTLYDATQWVMGARNSIADMLAMDRERVRIVAEFVGGGFGCKGFTWPHQALAAVAAKMVGRPVKLVLTRSQMYTACGHRPETRQHVVVAADKTGKLLALRHDTIAQTSTVDEYVEMCGIATPYLYACPNVQLTHKVVPVNIATPTSMRAPGENAGLFALESALDELSTLIGMDPVELRLRNDTDFDAQKNVPFSGRRLRECYELGRDRIGWRERSVAPRSMREGRFLIGYGMATATYPGYRFPGAAVVRLHDDGTASVASATQDIGGGTYTTMAQVAAQALGFPVDRIHVTLGDSRLPPAPVSGGSMTTASVMPAIKVAADAVLRKLAQYAVEDDRSPFHGVSASDLVADSGCLKTRDRRVALPFAEVLRSRKLARIEAEGHVGPGEEQTRYAFHSFGAQFAHVRVDPDLGVVRVARMVSVFDVGRVINAKTARSQALGGITQGIGMALMEQTLYDKRNGRVVTDNFADYLVPVNADVERIEPFFLDIPDPYINPLGARGVGEIAITGVAAAIANAVYHATGVRIRQLPITLEKLIGDFDTV